MCQSGARLSHLSSKGCVISPKGEPSWANQSFPLATEYSIEATFGKVYQLERGHKGTFWNAGNLRGLDWVMVTCIYTNVNKTKQNKTLSCTLCCI